MCSLPKHGAFCFLSDLQDGSEIFIAPRMTTLVWGYFESLLYWDVLFVEVILWLYNLIAGLLRNVFSLADDHLRECFDVSSGKYQSLWGNRMDILRLLLIEYSNDAKDKPQRTHFLENSTFFELFKVIDEGFISKIILKCFSSY